MAVFPSKLNWYWHRLRAMSPREVLLRLQKKSHQFADRRYQQRCRISLEVDGDFPVLPEKEAAPIELLAALETDGKEILQGRWKAFGHLPMAISDPPSWHADNVVGRNLQSNLVAFKLDHRAQPGKADIKVVWEPNRWYQMVRLAMAGWLQGNTAAQEKCVQWLHDWVTQNPPFTGLNWTSGLETGIRLIQFTWIDAFLEAAGVPNKTLQELRGRVLPAHVWYTWRYKSFGSSANNHLIGELAGLIIAQARWPSLQKLSAPIAKIGSLMEREILSQFAEDGGNKEQALGYHLFSWEFCFQSQHALESVNHPLSTEAKTRLAKAGQFYRALRPEADGWEFGDSDNAWVTPLFAHETTAAREWWHWFGKSSTSPALRYWWSDFRGEAEVEGAWEIFENSGYAVLRTGDWFLRLDCSPLGYLSMAPHGHLDVLHLSVWYRGQPVVVDPGTGAYYADKTLRNYLADWAAHNGPHLKAPPTSFPKRFGTFLWNEHHATPRLQLKTPLCVQAELDLPYGKATRTVAYLADRNAIRVQDTFTRNGSESPVVTRWKFAPNLQIKQISSNRYKVGAIQLETSAAWIMARTFNPPVELQGKVAPDANELSNVPIESLVSPAFRAVAAASYLVLESAEQGALEVLLSPE